MWFKLYNTAVYSLAFCRRNSLFWDWLLLLREISNYSVSKKTTAKINMT